PWFIELKNSKEQIKWFFEINKTNDSKKEELFYSGFTYPVENSKNTILMEFSRLKLLENFNLNNKFEHVNLWIASDQNELINLASGDNKKDSLQISTFEHFKKFEKIDSESFNFKYKNEVYWNSFKRFPSKIGIQYYLLTIPEKDIQSSNSSIYTNLLKWVSILLIFGGIILIFIKKGVLSRLSKIEMPSVKEILNEDENRYLEFKSSSRWDYRQEKTNPELEKVVLKTLAAFGNTEGGILLIGVDDDKKIIGLENDFNTLKKSTADFYEIHLRNLIHNAMGVKYVSNFIRMQFENCEDEKMICKIKVLPTNEPIYLKFKNKNGQVEEKFFVRSGNSSQEINSIAEITDYINTRFKK
ncbi:MAG: ATP-binding protein, partial [Flavobacteriaceae bacterium]|nr:ATP-binding protein [Flavobacteriaceae bacterium]